VIDAACAAVPVPRHAIEAGLVTDPAIREALATAVATLLAGH
jgi:hypothetical protein